MCVCTSESQLCMNCVCVWGEIGECFLGESYPRSWRVFWLSPSLCSSKGWWGGGGGHTSTYSMTGCQEEDSRSGVKWRAAGTVFEGEGRGGGMLSLHHSRTQQRQNLWRLPPTEGGGVTGAKYACTLMLGRWVLSLLMPARVICWQS